eukprot:CAMPEP_0169375792 /NCGR_PEP_ID=MMETSP1017-20121227/38300_1 /TAXON_ID=342587 /ORGANISM="Karlodinium micrum, Strain CCMP2283" /LENGTH=44 /DNA_ID= /DNA_START= /DNA_END= /DNA_ORIENTATION=
MTAQVTTMVRAPYLSQKIQPSKSHILHDFFRFLVERGAFLDRLE